MKKELVFIITICLFLFSYVLDYFAGALRLNITNPIQFLNQKYLMLYPMTFVSLVSRAIALTASVTLLLSLIDKKYITKIIISLFLGFIAEVYAFQQLATGVRFTSVIWTLSISYAGILLLIPIVVYAILGITNFLIPSQKANLHLKKDTNNENCEPSTLNP